ncbi:MAG: hypothetical protein HYZ29_17640 [Myxococcales bacterium]|nr:hypothetical protein [Myxococcales bacterium]
MVGGTASRGWVTGGGAVGQTVGFFSHGSAWLLVVLGPFLDWYPDEREGLHAGVMLGPAAVPLVRGTGVGGAVWGGYDLWVSDQWSMGLVARGIGSTSFSDEVIGGQVLLSMVHH